MHQTRYCSTLQEVDFANSRNSDALQKHFASGRGKIAYAATCRRPDESFENAQLSQVTTEQTDKSTLSIMKKTIKKLHYPAEIVYIVLDLPSVCILRYAGASFANNTDLSSQLGYIACGNTSMTTQPSFIMDHGSVSVLPVRCLVPKYTHSPVVWTSL